MQRTRCARRRWWRACAAAAHALPAIGGAVEWIVAAAGAGIFGLAIGAILIPVMEFAVAPAWRAVKSVLRERAA